MPPLHPAIGSARSVKAQEPGDPLPVGALGANRIVLAPDDGDEFLPKTHEATVPHDAARTRESGGSSIRLRDDAGSQDAVRAAGGGCGRPGAGVGCERPGAGEATSEGAVWRVNEGRGRSLSEIRGTG